MINQYAEMYGNPYSDGAAGNVAINVNESDHKAVDLLKLMILPDSGDAHPEAAGNPNCGAAAPAPPPTAVVSTGAGVGRAGASAVWVKLFKKAFVKRGRARVGRLACGGPCGDVKLLAKLGRKTVIGRGRARIKGRKGALTLRLTKAGKRLLAHKRGLKAKVIVWATPPGGRTVRRRGAVLLTSKPAQRRNHQHR